MEIREERHGEVAVLTPAGDVDATTLPQFERRVDRLLRQGVRGILFDLGAVGILPSAGVGFLLQTARRLQEKDGAIGLTGASGLVRATLRTLGVTDVFPLHDSRESALRELATRLAPKPAES